MLPVENEVAILSGAPICEDQVIKSFPIVSPLCGYGSNVTG